ncbi:MAG: DNA alkylation repair protein [Massilibacteroides sp.]|nr:DNA alkylation repair protein [Massilibacteroides sp.]MDD3061843.1 DNA alkylation repair protein [Massilibacteroides sp.]MDD4115505.1 DNA alkylation repair protein [Massilibacteroides sp.]MDD4660567.1 DNA alkylation repair protein [Massilibacteroides sp.]
MIRDIRVRLRQAMNGIVSTSMREKGVRYKLNFGASLSDLKSIAESYTPNVQLAAWLWEQDVREHKILATLLYPHEALTEAEADRWAEMICHQEIAEQFCANLMQYTPFAEKSAERWISDKKEYVQVCGFLLYARLYTRGDEASDPQKLLQTAKQVLDKGISRAQRAALLALKRFGRRSRLDSQTILALIEAYRDSESKERKEFYNDLKFEFDYYN